MDENKDFSQQEADGEFGRLFRTAFRGFNRQDVVECIARLTRDRDREQENAQIRMRELEETRDQLNLDLADARKGSAEKTAQLYQAQEQTEAAQAELAQTKADADARVEAATQALAAQCAQKDLQIEGLEREAALSKQLLLAARAENALLVQQAQAALCAAEHYAAQLGAARPTAVHAQRISSPRAQKLASVLQRMEQKDMADAALPLRAEQGHDASRDQKPAQTPRPEKIHAVQPEKTNVPRRTAAEKKWVNTLLSRLLND